MYNSFLRETQMKRRKKQLPLKYQLQIKTYKENLQKKMLNIKKKLSIHETIKIVWCFQYG